MVLSPMTNASALYQAFPFPAKGIDCKAAGLDLVPMFYRRNEKSTGLEDLVWLRE